MPPPRLLRLRQPWQEMNDIKPQLQYYRIPFEWKFKPINFSTLCLIFRYLIIVGLLRFNLEVEKSITFWGLNVEPYLQ